MNRVDSYIERIGAIEGAYSTAYGDPITRVLVEHISYIYRELIEIDKRLGYLESKREFDPASYY